MYTFGKPIYNNNISSKRNITFKSPEKQLISTDLLNSLKNISANFNTDTATFTLDTAEFSNSSITELSVESINSVNGSDNFFKIISAVNISRSSNNFISPNRNYILQVNESTNDIYINNRYVDINNTQLKIKNNKCIIETDDLSTTDNVFVMNLTKTNMTTDAVQTTNANPFNFISGILAKKSLFDVSNNSLSNLTDTKLGYIMMPNFDVNNSNNTFSYSNSNSDTIRFDNNKSSVRFMYTKYDYGNDSSLTTNSDFNTHLAELNSNTYQDYYLPLEIDRLALHGGIISNPIGTSTDNSKRNISFHLYNTNNNNNISYFDIMSLVNNYNSTTDTILNNDNILEKFYTKLNSPLFMENVDNILPTIYFNNNLKFNIPKDNTGSYDILNLNRQKLSTNVNISFETKLNTNYNGDNNYYGIEFNDVINIFSGTDKFMMFENGVDDNIYMYKNTSINGDLVVTGSTDFSNMVASGDFKVDGKSFFYNNLSVIDKTDVNNPIILLNVDKSSGNTTIGGNLQVDNEFYLHNNFNIVNITDPNNHIITAYIESNTGNIYTNGTTTLTGMLNANGGITCDTNKFIVADTTGNTTIGGTLDVTGTTTLTGMLNANGGITCDTNKFIVADTTGNTTIGGTLDVTGTTTLTGILNANGGITCDTNKFIVADTTGNTTIGGTLDVTGTTTLNGMLNANGGIVCDTNKFIVADTTGNTTIGGTLDVTGTTTLTGMLNANGGIVCDTNKFIVADTTGNTTIGGTLDVTGTTTLTGMLNANGGITCDTNKFIVADTTGNTTIGGTLDVTGTITIGDPTNSNTGGTINSGNGTITIDPHTVGNNSGSLIIAGDLIVNGTTTSVNSTTINIGDNIIILNNNETGIPSQNAGLEIERGTSTNVSFLWNETNDEWTTGNENLNVGGTITGPTITGINNKLDQDVKTTSNVTFNNLITTGTTTLTGILNANGGIVCDTNKFIVADTTGNTTIGGTLDVTGTTTLTGNLITTGTITGPTITGINNMLDQDVKTTSNVTFNNLITTGTITGPTITGINNKLDQDVKTTSNVTFNNLITTGTITGPTITGINNMLDQDVKTTSNVTFNNITTTGTITGPTITGIQNDITTLQNGSNNTFSLINMINNNDKYEIAVETDLILRPKYSENSFYSNTNEYNVTNSNSSFRSDTISIPSNTTLKTIEISFKNSSNGAHPNGGFYGLLCYGYQFSLQPFPACNNQNFNYFYIDNVNNKIGMFNGTSGATGLKSWDYNISHGNLFNNVYHHFIALINVSTNSVTIYIDGINIGTQQFSDSLEIDHDTDGIALGSNGINADNPEYFLGYVKDFYIYNKVLSTQEIATRYSIFQGNTPPSTNNIAISNNDIKLTNATITGILNANGGIVCDTNKFIVADTTGNTTIGGTLDVTGTTTLTGNLITTGTITGPTITGINNMLDQDVKTTSNVTFNNITTTGTITGPTITGINNMLDQDVKTTSNVTFNNITTTGTTTLTGMLNANGGITCDTNKFIVADTTGNTTIGGTLDITGTITIGDPTNSNTGGTINSGNGTITIDPHTVGNNSGSLIIAGDLIVNGTTTSVNSTTINIGDNIIILNNNETGIPSQNAGLEIERGTSANVSFLWNETNDEWTTGNENLNVGGTITGPTITGINNKLDQDVKTTSNVTFNNLITTGTITGPTITGINNMLDQDVKTTSNVTFNNITTTGTITGPTITGINNKLDQDVKTTSNVTFNNLITTGIMGIGIENPTEKLHVIGNVKSTGNINIADDTNSTSIIGKLKLGYMGYDDWAGISHLNRASQGNYALIQNSVGQTVINCSPGQKISFNENNSEKMTIKDGKVGIGISNPDSVLHIVGQKNNNTLTEGIHLGHNGNPDYGIDFVSGTNANGVYLDFNRTNSGITDFVGRIYYLFSNNTFNFTRTINAPGWSSSSDDRLKHNEININNALKTIMKLSAQNYDKTNELKEEDFKGELKEGTFTKESGFIAQEVYMIDELKHLVTVGDEKTHWGINYNGLFTYNIQATQELNNIVKEQKDKIDNLEKTILNQNDIINDLKQKVEELYNNLQ